MAIRPVDMASKNACILFLCLWVTMVTGAMSSVGLETLSTKSLDVHNQEPRDLQSDTRLWDISPPEFAYSGMQLDLVHTVRDQVQTSYVEIELFRDEACSIPLENNNYIAIDIINDLTDFGDGSGTRQVCTTRAV